MAIVILGTVGIGLSKLLVTAARTADRSGGVAYRAAALNTEVSRISAIPDGMLPDTTTSRTVTARPFPHTITTVSVTSGSVQTVTITLTPTGGRAIGGLVRTLIRRAGASPSPFS
jgi:hypothetical protein